jgi:hypothetical protein
MDMALPPKFVHPIQAAPFSFKQVLSDKLHSTLVIKPVGSNKIAHALHSLVLSSPTKSIFHHSTLTDASDPKSKIANLLCKERGRTYLFSQVTGAK